MVVEVEGHSCGLGGTQLQVPGHKARALLKNIASFGVPSDISSDRGRQFTSDLWRQLPPLKCPDYK